MGLRGQTDSGWDWETAILKSKAESEDFTQNRLSNSLLQAGLNDSTSNAINIFSSDVKTDENILIAFDVESFNPA